MLHHSPSQEVTVFKLHHYKSFINYFILTNINASTERNTSELSNAIVQNTYFTEKYFRYGSKQMATQLCLQKGQGSFHEPTASEEQASVSSSRSLPFCRRSCSGSSPQGPQLPRCQGQQVLGPCLPLVTGAVGTRTEVRATPGCREHVKDTQQRDKDSMGEPRSRLQLQQHPTKMPGQATALRAEQKAHRGRLAGQWQHPPSALHSPGRGQSKQLCSPLLITQPASSRSATRPNPPSPQLSSKSTRKVLPHLLQVMPGSSQKHLF